MRRTYSIKYDGTASAVKQPVTVPALGSCVVVTISGDYVHGKIVHASATDITLTPSHHTYGEPPGVIQDPSVTIDNTEIIGINDCSARRSRLDSTHMSITHRMDRYAVSFITMVASVAGCTAVTELPDIRKYDMILGSRYIGAARRYPNIYVQVKSHRMLANPTKQGVPIKIDRECFQEFRQVDSENRLLIGVAVPDDVEHWLTFSASEMMSRFQAYYCIIRGSAMIAGDMTTVRAPLRCKLTPSVLIAMMHRIGDKGSLRG